MKQDFIEKLPPDAQKEFLKLAMKLDEKTKQTKIHGDLFYLLFGTFGHNLLKVNITKKLRKNLMTLQTAKLKD